MKQISIRELTFPLFLGRLIVISGKDSECDCAIDTAEIHQLGYAAALTKEHSNKRTRGRILVGASGRSARINGFTVRYDSRRKCRDAKYEDLSPFNHLVELVGRGGGESNIELCQWCVLTSKHVNSFGLVNVTARPYRDHFSLSLTPVLVRRSQFLLTAGSTGTFIV